MIAICKYSRDINTRKGEELLKLKNNVGRRTNVYKLTWINLSWNLDHFFPKWSEVLEQPSNGRNGSKPPNWLVRIYRGSLYHVLGCGSRSWGLVTQEKLFLMSELTEYRFFCASVSYFKNDMRNWHKNKILPLQFMSLLRKGCGVLSGHSLKCFTS